MHLEVRALPRGEIGPASLVLARAFAADPFIGYFLADQRRRHLALPRFFSSVLHELIEQGAISAALYDGNLAGVAAWVPPDAGSPSTLARVRSKVDAAIVRALFPRAAPRMLEGFTAIAEHHPEVRHWYLAFVGVEPSLQGRGIGKALIQPVIARADEDGDHCYLETPFPATHDFYRTLGFTLGPRLEPVVGAPPVWTMSRPPSPAAR